MSSHPKIADWVSAQSTSSVPVRTDAEFPLGLYLIVGLKPNHEKVRATHPLMHREFRPDFGLLPRLQGRRTDDHLGGSAALNRLDAGTGRNLERSISYVLQAEAGVHEFVEANLSEIDLLPVHR